MAKTTSRPIWPAVDWCCCYLSVSVCADWALLDELVDTQLGWILLCWHGDCTLPLPPFGPWAWIYEAWEVQGDRSSAGGRSVLVGVVYSLTSLLSPSIVRHLFAYFEYRGVIRRGWPVLSRSFLHLVLASYFSCSNSFVLPDTCEIGRCELLFLQLCAPPHPFLIWASVCHRLYSLQWHQNRFLSFFTLCSNSLL